MSHLHEADGLSTARMIAYAGTTLLGAYAVQLMGVPVFDWLFLAVAVLIVLAAFTSDRLVEIRPGFLVAGGLLITAGCLSAMVWPGAYASLGRLLPVLYLYVVWLPLFGTVIRKPAHLELLLAAAVISAGITGLAAAFQAAVGSSTLLAAPMSGRMTGLLRHPDELGAYCAMVLPLGFAVVWLAKTRWMRLVWALVVVAILAGLVLSASMTGLFAAMLAVSVFLLSSPEDGRLKGWLVLLGLILALPALWAVASPLVRSAGVPLLTERLAKTGAYGLRSDPNNTLWARVYADKEALASIMAHPLVGVGFDTVVPRVGTLVHNGFLRFWYESGVLGLASVTSILVMAVRSLLGLRVCVSDPDHRTYLLQKRATAASLAAYMTVFLVSPIMTDRSSAIALAVAFAFNSAWSSRSIRFGRTKHADGKMGLD